MQKIRWTHLFWCLIAATFMVLTLLGVKLVFTSGGIIPGVLMIVCGVASLMLWRSCLRVLEGKPRNTWIDRMTRVAIDTW